ncbi:hydantoinase B/oxoprolinase family protein [Agrobacterium tumefaciens]|uniref:hydantoinase B/oxoprolinase family protein n=1 Tax=Agrobacterium tumefaciens TaxID=358 RepID=UPI0021D2806E|nr:hydantoinase B/oxoprolinase family protein [Agrobacterium tumefaciens]UXS53060.1 hydantoinase B/oxoprolinase family protein [Agrobacterium tumefaciens]UXS63304.1 hydantoinase B/oxoprolinase family protein [Agrobacterium tumefaciens]
MMKIDPITVEVIGSALTSIVEEMGEALVRASYSTNIKERRDCSTALFDRNGNTLCQAEHIPMHLGSFIGIISHINKRYAADDIKRGDMFIGNDAYEGGGTHLPDIVLAEPIFHEGTMVGWAVNTAHHADFADRGHAHIYQEGIRLPPVRLYREGELQEDLQSVFLLNCQVPHERLSDLRAQVSANRLGVQRMQDLCTKYGADKMLAAGDALQDYAERKMRAGIAAIPDGTYSFTDYFDANLFPGSMELKVDITITGDAMHLAFDAPPQIAAGLNVVYTALLATCYYAVKALIDPTILPNAGLSRPITVEAPQGSLLNCKHPAAVDGRIAACDRAADIVQGALAKALPGKVSAAGCGACTGAAFVGAREDGSLWVFAESIGGGGGARPTADGLSGIHVHLSNTSNLPVEALELEYPLTLLRYELVDGSAGAGTWRGGMGIRRVYRIETEGRFTAEYSRITNYPWGLEGGLQGAGSYAEIGNGEKKQHETVSVKAGQILEVVTPGGGGYGAPSGRPMHLIERDIKEERITAEFARRVYGYGAEQKSRQVATA